MWPYEPSNSPLPLPPQPVVFTQQHLYWIDAEQIENAEMSLNEIKTCIADWKTESGLSIDAILQQEDAAPMNERRPILLLGELANPHRLANINAGPPNHQCQNR